MILEGKKNADGWLPFMLVDAVDLVTPEPGKVYSDLTVEYRAAGTAAWATATIADGDLIEHGDGAYDLKFGAAEFAAEGYCWVHVECAGCHDPLFVVLVRDKTGAELIDAVDALPTANTSAVPLRVRRPLNSHKNILHVFCVDAAASDGRGKTGLLYGDFSGRYVRENGTLSAALAGEDVAVLGTYQAPSDAAHFRIKEVSAANAPGLYELHLPDTWLAQSGWPRQFTLLLSATGMVALPIVIELEPGARLRKYDQDSGEKTVYDNDQTSLLATVQVDSESEGKITTETPQ